MQTILGSGGAIGTPLAKELFKYTDKVRLVARNPKKVNESDELFRADLTKKEEVDKAVAGSDIVYLTVGLPYNTKVWQHDWPLIMGNVIDACIAHKTKLVFFDNVYAYSESEIPNMTEHSRIAPATKKGKVREGLLKMIFNAIDERKLTALIARSADFYGPDGQSSFLKVSVIDQFRKNKKAFWQSDATTIHSFTYTPDAAKAVAVLGNTPDAYNQTWHLPTSAEKWTGRDFINTIAAQMHTRPRYFILSKFLIMLAGIFSPVISELKEMQYQNNQNYFFDSSKFVKRFSFAATSYETGIKETLQEESRKSAETVKPSSTKRV